MNKLILRPIATILSVKPLPTLRSAVFSQSRTTYQFSDLKSKVESHTIPRNTNDKVDKEHLKADAEKRAAYKDQDTKSNEIKDKRPGEGKDSSPHVAKFAENVKDTNQGSNTQSSQGRREEVKKVDEEIRKKSDANKGGVGNHHGDKIREEVSKLSFAGEQGKTGGKVETKQTSGSEKPLEKGNKDIPKDEVNHRERKDEVNVNSGGIGEKKNESDKTLHRFFVPAF